MNLRAVILGWPDPSTIQREHRLLLEDLLQRTMSIYPADQEEPTPDAPIPASSVAASRYNLEDAYSPVKWDDPPLADAQKVLCIEGPEPAQLYGVAAMWRDEAVGVVPGLALLPVGVGDRIYTSPTIASVAYEHAIGRQSRSVHPEALLWSFKRTPQWWDLTPLERQALFLPRMDSQGQMLSPGHIDVSAPLVSVVHRRLYHETYPEGSTGVMVGWFETAAQHMEALKQVVGKLQDVSLTPDHGFYQCGPLWWGRRISANQLGEELSS